jgi:hypothetical protein
MEFAAHSSFAITHILAPDRQSSTFGTSATSLASHINAIGICGGMLLPMVARRIIG